MKKLFTTYYKGEYRDDCLLNSSGEELIPDDYCGSCEPTKVKVEAYYTPTIKDIAQVFLEADEKEQGMFFNLLAEGFNRFNEENPGYRQDSQLASIGLEGGLSDEAKEFIEKLDIFANERF